MAQYPAPTENLPIFDTIVFNTTGTNTSNTSNATTVNVVDQSSTSGIFDIAILQGVSGALPVGASTGLTYNNTTGLSVNGDITSGGNVTLNKSNGSVINFSSTSSGAIVQSGFSLTLQALNNNAIYIGSTYTNINQRTVFNSTIGLTSTALTYTNADLGYTASFLDNHNYNIVSGTIYSLAVNIPSNGVWLCSGSLCLIPGGTDAMTFIGTGFTFGSGYWDNPQSGLTISRTMNYNAVTLTNTGNPYHQFQNGTCVYKNTSGALTIYFTVQMNWTGSTLQFISEAQITRIG